MKRLKTVRLAAAVAAMTFALACSGGQRRAVSQTTSLTEGVTTMAIDSLTLTTIKDNEGDKRMPNKLFYGDSDSAKVERLSPEGSVPSSVSCFIVETGGKKILFDTGNGTARGGKMLERLKAAGISPEDIDFLVITHFHGDHIGGMTLGGKAVFTKAEVYVPDKEYASWLAMSSRNVRNAMHAMSAYGSRLHRFNYGEPLPLGIKAMPAPGHTPGHTVYRIGRLFIAGDLMHGFDLQIKDLDICPDYDMDREQAVESRRKYIEYVRQNKLIVAGMHFPGNGVKEAL